MNQVSPVRARVIAIDGPSGSGKSSTSRGVARQLGFDYLDTGAMYRAATWLVMQHGIDAADVSAVVAAVEQANLEISTAADQQRVVVDGIEVTSQIRSPQVAQRVSQVAAIPQVRELLINQQRQIIAAAGVGIVVEGRDITTVVAPDADVRLLLVADPAERVRRRQGELAAVSTAEVTEQVLGRDRRDGAVTEFAVAAPGVVTIDSTELDLEQTIARVAELITQSELADDQ